MSQMTLAVNGFEAHRKTTRKAKFPGRMDKLVPWSECCSVIEPFYPKASRLMSIAAHNSADIAQNSNPSAIQAKMVKLLCRQATTVFLGAVLTSSLLGFVLWSRVSQLELLLWLGATYALTAVRAVSVWRFRTQGAGIAQDALAWRYRFTFFTLLPGVARPLACCW